MPRFFFHSVSPDSRANDYEGAEFASSEDAINDARASAREIAGRRMVDGRDVDGTSIEVSDAAGTVLAEVSIAAEAEKLV